MKVCLTIHRSAAEIGGNCIEVANNGSRILLDIGRGAQGDVVDCVELLGPIPGPPLVNQYERRKSRGMGGCISII